MNLPMSSPGLDAELETLIRSLQQTAPDRVFSASHHGQRLWIKTIARPRLRSAVLMQKAIALLFRLPVLQPALNRDGARGLADEAAALHKLAGGGFPVPPVIA